jgi:hypothetical protein
MLFMRFYSIGWIFIGGLTDIIKTLIFYMPNTVYATKFKTTIIF